MSPKSIGLLFVLCCLACVHPRIRPVPAAGDSFHILDIKFSFQDSRGRQNGRIHWRFDERNAKFLFFTPLNQLGLELDVAGETALLLRPGRLLYWRGGFSNLLARLWGIDLSLEELKRLVSDGRIPQEKAAALGISIELESGPEGPAPRTVHIGQGDGKVTLRIIKTETRPGQVVLLDRVHGLEPAGLEEILADD